MPYRSFPERAEGLISSYFKADRFSWHLSARQAEWLADKNSIPFRAVCEDSHGGKKSHCHVAVTPGGPSIRARRHQVTWKFDRVRSSSPRRWRLKFPLLHVQIPTPGDTHRRDKRARAGHNYFASGQIREVYSGWARGYAGISTTGEYSAAATHAYFRRTANFAAPRTSAGLIWDQESELTATSINSRTAVLIDL